MVLYKIFQWCLMPSGFLFILLITSLIFLFKRRRKKTCKIILLFVTILYYLFSITPISDLILLPLERQYQPLQKEEINKANTIVLLLGGKESDFLRVNEVFRIYHLEIINEKPIPKIIISGSDPLNAYKKEAEEIKNYLAELGIRSESVILEDESKNTKENAENVKEIVKNQPFFLVTSAYHMPRAMEAFKKLGVYPIAAPTDFKIETTYDVLDFFPQAINLKNSDLAIHEYLGIIFYKLISL